MFQTGYYLIGGVQALNGVSMVNSVKRTTTEAGITLYRDPAICGSMYGYRGRLGLIVPSSNSTNEPEFWQWIPRGVSIHTARMRLVGVNAEELIDMADDVERAVSLLKTAAVDAIAFGCTTGSLVKGKGYDERLTEMIEEDARVPAMATSTAIKLAFDAVGAHTLAVATPYVDDMNSREVDFLEDNGYRVSGITGLDIEPNLEIGRQDPARAYRLAREIDNSDADAIFLSCTNFRTLDILDHLEEDCSKPVISSNSATLWAALNLLEIDTSELELGQLFQRKLNE